MSNAILQTQHWLEQWVIGQNLCPFAAKPYRQGQVRFVASDAVDAQVVLSLLEVEVSALQSSAKVETTLLVLTQGYSCFYTYLALVELCEQWLSKQGLDGVFQIASFHPQYQFAGTEESDVSNYTNRSPWPLLHILREQSITEVVGAGVDTDAIPQRNIELMQEMGVDGVSKYFDLKV